jgi:hypothetical protein
MWLTGRLAPDFKTIADFRKDNGPAIRATCRRFIEMCRRLNLFAHAVAAIDGSKFKAVNARDKNFTRAKLQKRMEQVEATVDVSGSGSFIVVQHGDVASQHVRPPALRVVPQFRQRRFIGVVPLRFQDLKCATRHGLVVVEVTKLLFGVLLRNANHVADVHGLVGLDDVSKRDLGRFSIR